ncbi:disulfide bond formation protein B [Candidatus Parcubacteria bacterium]|nr:disulfide bond formation protein B [Candidatus Parcubacteria bacterium]
MITQIIPPLVLISNIVFVLVVLALVFKVPSITSWIGKHSVVLGLLVVLASIIGSLYYSLGLGYEPCELCWWQRILLYPQLILFLTALKHKDGGVFRYSWRLTALAAAVSLYQIYAQSGGKSLLACTSAGGACLKVYVHAFGYITIPVMSLTVCAYLLLLAYISKKHD